MRSEQKPYKICRAGGRNIPIYLKYDEVRQETYPAYPDFQEHPEYTDDGRPFATAEQDSCSFCKPKTPDKPPPDDCGGCGWFYREQTPYDPIGICMCDGMRRNNQSEKEIQQ